MLMALRINTLAKGYSGISIKTLNQVINAFNSSCLPWVPEQGTVGASGDLAPLSHLALGMIGEGKVGDSNLQTPITTSSMPFMEYVNVQGGSIAQSLE
jgi:histidine ammonia-lyase